MAIGGEVVTLQFGHYANHVGAHLWNMHEAQLDYHSSSSSLPPPPSSASSSLFPSGTRADSSRAVDDDDVERGGGEGEDVTNVLFRAGETLHGMPTYTPRLLLFDLQGSLRALPKVRRAMHACWHILLTSRVGRRARSAWSFDCSLLCLISRPSLRISFPPVLSIYVLLCVEREDA
jgi:hypothetical protein